MSEPISNLMNGFIKDYESIKTPFDGVNELEKYSQLVEIMLGPLPNIHFQIENTLAIYYVAYLRICQSTHHKPINMHAFMMEE